MADNNEPSIIVGSRTQSAETIQKLLSEDYEGITVKTESDQPAEEPAAKPVKDNQDEEEGGETADDSSESSTDASAEAAGEEDEDETASAEAAGQETATDAAHEKPKKSTAARQKERFARMAARIEELERKQAGQPASAAKDSEPDIVIPEAEPDPDPDDFENGVYDTGYMKALAAADRKNAKREELIAAKTERDSKVTETVAARAQAEKEARENAWKEQQEIGRSRHDDFDEVLKKAAGLQAEPVLTEALFDSEMSGELTYYLATHPEELAKLNKKLNLPADATSVQFRRMMKVAHREIDALEQLVSQDAGSGAEDDAAEEATDNAAPGSASQTTEPTRESRPAAASSPKPAAAPPAALPKAKPTPVKPVGSRGGAIRPKRIQDMTREEIHSMQERDPDGFRKLMEASRVG